MERFLLLSLFLLLSCSENTQLDAGSVVQIQVSYLEHGKPAEELILSRTLSEGPNTVQLSDTDFRAFVLELNQLGFLTWKEKEGEWQNFPKQFRITVETNHALIRKEFNQTVPKPFAYFQSLKNKYMPEKEK